MQSIFAKPTAVLLFVFATSGVSAATIFSQTPGGLNSASGSDVASSSRHASPFSLASDATVRSASWRGPFLDPGAVAFPTNFNLTIYADDAGLPGAVLSDTAVLATGVPTGSSLGSRPIYDFQADLTPVALTAGTDYWFSVLADTSSDTNARWMWSNTSGGTLALQFDTDVNSPWFISGVPLTVYFTLDDEALNTGSAIPSPTAALAGLVGLAGLGMRRRRG